ncbi:AAA family ATPase [Bacteroidota bacterium]
MQIRKAERKQAKIKMGLQGPSGSGKTLGALKIAAGITEDWGKVALIDTECHSADLYASIGTFSVVSLSPPYAPERYIEAMDLCLAGGFEVIIIDSISHEWEGDGGILDVHGNMAGNSFTNWAKVTPRHNAFVNAILQCPAHVISTIRTKQDYVLNEKNGKYVPEKVGLKGITRDGMDYEFTLVLDIDHKHNAVASKDRTRLFSNQPEFRISKETGRKIIEWCGSGTSAEDVIQQIESCNSTQQLVSLYEQYPEFQDQLKERFSKRQSSLQQAQPNSNLKLSDNGGNNQ